jgi:hypothetical protein
MATFLLFSAKDFSAPLHPHISHTNGIRTSKLKNFLKDERRRERFANAPPVTLAASHVEYWRIVKP